MRILVCGGAGYIGTHTCVALSEQGHKVVVLDNLSNGSRRALERVGELVGGPVEFIEGDIRRADDLARAFATPVDGVIHFAALKSVGDSCSQPLEYFDNNIAGTISLLRAMDAAAVTKLVFSSSATVYGNAKNVPVTESSPLQVTNPYGRTKLVMEELIRDYCDCRPDFSAVLLRYFNPVGSHPSGMIGDSPAGVPNNLMPYMTQVGIGRREHLRIFGGDYPTPDGTGIRDYIHVMDLADAHVRSVDYVSSRKGCHVFNLGTGQGLSVLELVRTFERVTGVPIPYSIEGRRSGDVAELWADPSLAKHELQWHPRHGVESMCNDAWRWQLGNPHGYDCSED